MIATPRSFHEALQHAVTDPPAGIDPWFRDYHGDLAHARGREVYLRAKEQLLELIGGVDAIRDKVVLDAGSGFGMVSNVMATWGARQVIALEIFAPMAATHRRVLQRDLPDLASRIVQAVGDVKHMPLRDASVDVLLSIEAISHYYDVGTFLDECARVLRPGGMLVVSDGNNGANPGIRKYTEELWVRIEKGPSGTFGDRQVGDSMQSRRETIVASAFPQLTPERVKDLAERTSGMDKREIVRAVEEHLRGGPAPESRYRRGDVPRDPNHGYVLEALFDPPQLARDIARRGFDARAIAHYGGASSELVLIANRVLRVLPTCRFARAFRIVAKKK